jgi:hypothetical protein
MGHRAPRSTRGAAAMQRTRVGLALIDLLLIVLLAGLVLAFYH